MDIADYAAICHKHRQKIVPRHTFIFYGWQLVFL